MGDRPATWQRGVGDGLTRAFELVLTPLLFGALGWLVDAWAGTRPLMTLVFGLLGAVGVFAATYYRYQAEMAREEEGKPWTRRPR
ncbi:MAG: AtpZ/AtpI family protein [Acidimicrobiia bacterium]|nr:AtpZ/AtpI family protein [Acidimicrobiia bacterium]